jgi:acetamidase/formamidase
MLDPRTMPAEPAFIEPRDDAVCFTFGGHRPIATVTPGALLRVRTRDCFDGQVLSVDDLPSRVCTWPNLNPVTGPFYVLGAMPGDTIAVHIVDLAPARPFGFSSTFPHFGALTATVQSPTLQPPLDERVWRWDIDRTAGTVRYQARNSDFAVDLPLDPMLGTVGVAPAAGEARMTIVPDRHGGNMDTPELRAGTTLYLGVNTPGALLAFGDGHARQGDGELCGVAVEVPMDVTVVVDVLNGVDTPTPRIESDTHLMSVGAARPLEDAYRIAHHDLVQLVTDLTALDRLDAYQLVSQAAETRIGNVVDPNYVAVARLDKALLGAAAYNGAHETLRSCATARLADERAAAVREPS